MSQFDTLRPQDLVALLPADVQAHWGEPAHLQVLYTAYLEVGRLLEDWAIPIGRNLVLGETELGRRVPFALLTLEQGLYTDADFAAANPGWSTWTIPQRMVALQAAGAYEPLIFDSPDIAGVSAPVTGIPNAPMPGIVVPPPTVWTLALTADFAQQRPYLWMGDYVVWHNNLYLFGDLAVPVPSPKQVYAWNLWFDSGKLTSLWGTLMGIMRPGYFSSAEYRAALNLVAGAFLQGPSIEVLATLLGQVNGWSGFTVEDQYNAAASRQYLWTSGEFTPFDWLATVPLSAFPDLAHLQFNESLMDALKPADTLYNFLMTSEIIEILPGTDGLELTTAMTMTDPMTVTWDMAGALWDDGAVWDSGLSDSVDLIVDYLTTTTTGAGTA